MNSSQSAPGLMASVGKSREPRVRVLLARVASGAVRSHADVRAIAYEMGISVPYLSRLAYAETGAIPRDKADDLCILVGVFIHWDAADDQKIFDYNYQATKESIARALAGTPTVSEVIAGATTAKHPSSPK